MSNIHSVSKKLQPVSNSNNENSAIASSSKKQHFHEAMFGKENVSTGNKQSATTKNPIRRKNAFLSPEKQRTRKVSDSAIYSSKRRQDIPDSVKIQHLINHWDLKELVPPKRHLSENTESSTNSHGVQNADLFSKADFEIFRSNEDITGQDASCSKNRTGIPKAEKLHIQKAKIVEYTRVEKRVKIIKPPQNELKKAKHPRVQNLVNTASNTENTTTPVEQALNLPPILNKIKVHHKKSAIDEKYAATLVDNSPPELIYNLEYMEDFMDFQLELERSHKLSAKFLTKNVTPGQRRKVISFLIRVTAYCSYPSFILYQTVRIFDDMLDSKRIEIDQLQLVALTALWITLKRLHILSNIPSAEALLSFAKHEYDEEQLYRCEMDIMKTLNFEISYIEPFSILAYYFININNPFVKVTRTDMMYYFGSYMDVSAFYIGLNFAQVKIQCEIRDMIQSKILHETRVTIRDENKGEILHEILHETLNEIRVGNRYIN
ncbi:uncharacterized protein LOC117170838 [Belonocnema kinseyi]|uniref:uncharacterized protein LOC117170838 n=1 Tax=Belonocnema kinseyi TaxID=2817044 RepID=UPI00143D3AEA|nr:uncharacterized protein LOC117170838 [Belonocnema kinseyi]